MVLPQGKFRIKLHGFLPFQSTVSQRPLRQVVACKEYETSLQPWPTFVFVWKLVCGLCQGCFGSTSFLSVLARKTSLGPCLVEFWVTMASCLGAKICTICGTTSGPNLGPKLVPPKWSPINILIGDPFWGLVLGPKFSPQNWPPGGDFLGTEFGTKTGPQNDAVSGFLGWAGLGYAGLGWAGLGWVGLCWAWLG